MAHSVVVGDQLGAQDDGSSTLLGDWYQHLGLQLQAPGDLEELLPLQAELLALDVAVIVVSVYEGYGELAGSVQELDVNYLGFLQLDMKCLQLCLVSVQRDH